MSLVLSSVIYYMGCAIQPQELNKVHMLKFELYMNLLHSLYYRCQ
jgi:hypothetical protein